MTGLYNFTDNSNTCLSVGPLSLAILWCDQRNKELTVTNSIVQRVLPVQSGPNLMHILQQWDYTANMHHYGVHTICMFCISSFCVYSSPGSSRECTWIGHETKPNQSDINNSLNTQWIQGQITPVWASVHAVLPLPSHSWWVSAWLTLSRPPRWSLLGISSPSLY